MSTKQVVFHIGSTRLTEHVGEGSKPNLGGYRVGKRVPREGVERRNGSPQPQRSLRGVSWEVGGRPGEAMPQKLGSGGTNKCCLGRWE